MKRKFGTITLVVVLSCLMLVGVGQAQEAGVTLESLAKLLDTLTGTIQELTNQVDALAGPTIVGVGDDTPAAASGLKEGDVITSIDGVNIVGIEGRNGLTVALSKYAPGDKVQVTANREGETITVSATLTTHPEDSEKGYLGVFLVDKEWLTSRVIALAGILYQDGTAVGDEGVCRIAMNGRIQAISLAIYLDTYPDAETPDTEIIGVFIMSDGSVAVNHQTTEYGGPYITESWQGCEFLSASDWWEEE